MKKSRNICILSVLIGLLVATLTGCGCGQQVSVSDVVFENSTIELVVGDVYELGATVLPDNATNKNVRYLDDDAVQEGTFNYIIDRLSGNRIAAKYPGIANVYAVSVEGSKRATLEIRVFASRVTLDTPIGVRYENGKIVWDEVNYYIGSTAFTPEGYVVELNGVAQPITQLTEFTNFQIGIENEVRIKAIGSNSVVSDSEYSTSVTFTELLAPTNLTREGTTLSWDSVTGAVSYRIYVNGVLAQSNITSTSSIIDFDTAGNYGVTVSAVPDTTTLTQYESRPSKVLSIVKLSTVEQMSIENSILSWNEILGDAVEYNVIFTKPGTEVVANTGVNNFLDLRTAVVLTPGDWSVTVRGVSNITSGIDSNLATPLQFNKLAPTTVLGIYDNELTWEMNDNSELDYSVMVNSETAQVVTRSFTLPNSANAGNYAIKVKVNGNGTNIIDSNWSDAFDAIKLGTPTGVTHNQNTIMFDKIDGAYSVVVYDIEDAQNPVTYNGNLSVVGQQCVSTISFVNKTNSISEIESNHYTIVVKAEGQDGGRYFDSKVSTETTEFYKMVTPLNFQYVEPGVREDMPNGGWTWNSVDTNENVDKSFFVLYLAVYMTFDYVLTDNGYSYSFHNLVKFSGYDEDENEVVYFEHLVTPDTGLLTQAEMDLVSAGTIFISVCNVANGIELINSDYITPPIVSKKNYEPINISVVDNKLVWETDDPDGYTNTDYHIELVGEGENQELDIVNGSLEWTLPSSWVAGNEYDIVIYATGADIQFKSRIVEYTVERLNAPIVSAGEGFVQWNEVENATDYDVYVNGAIVEDITLNSTGGVVTWEYDFIEAGSYEIVVYANANSVSGNHYMISEGSQIVTITKLGIDNVAVTDNKITWTNNVQQNVLTTIKIYISGSDDVFRELTTSENSKLITDMNLGAGVFTFTLNSCYDDSTQNADRFIESELFTSNSDFEVLAAPVPVYDADTFMISWGEIVGAEGYVVKSEVSIDGVITVRYSSVITDLNFNLSTSQVIKGGVVNLVKVRAVGDGTNTINSVFGTDTGISVGKALETTITSGIASGEFYQLNWTSIANATYTLYVNGSKINENVTDTSYSYELDNMTDAGDYVFNVVTCSTIEGVIPSSFSNDWVVTRLDAVTNVSITNNVLNWDAMDNANGYRIIINNADTSTNYFNSELLDNYLNLVGVFPSGNYYISVTAVGDDIHTLESSEIIIENIVKLQSVTSFNINATNRDFEWNEVVGVVDGYEIVFYQKDELGEVVESSITSFVEMENLNANEPQTLGSGIWYVYIIALGDGELLLDSDKSSELQVEKLQTPTNLAHNGNIITFDQVEGCDDYIIVINNGTVDTIIDFGFTVFGYAYDFTDTGVYTIRVITAGDYIDTINSDASQIVSVERLAYVTNFDINNNVLTWSANSNASGYTVIFEGVETYIYTTTECSYTIDSTPSGNYEVGVYANGNGTEFLSGYYVYLTNNIDILGIPSNIGFVNKEITWDNVSNNYGYEIILYNEGVDRTITLTTAQDVNTIALPVDLESGNWSIFIKAFGDDKYIVDSLYSNEVVVSKYATPNAVAHCNEYITIDISSGAPNYAIYIYLDDVLDTTIYATSAETVYHYDFAVAGLYEIYLQILGDYETTIDSDRSEYTTVRRIEQIQSIAVSNNQVVWDSNQYVFSNSFGYKVIFVNGGITNEYTTSLVSYTFDIEDLTSGDYTIDVIGLAGDNVLYLPSLTNVIDGIHKINTPIISSSLVNNYIVWTVDDSNNSVLGYQVVVMDEFDTIINTHTITDALVKQFQLGSEYSDGTYRVKVRAFGDGVNAVRSNYSNVKQVEKLPVTVVNIARKTISDNLSPYGVSWTKVNNATKYVLEFSNGKVVTTLNGDVVFYNLDEDSDIGTGSFYVKVIAVGDNSDYVNSNYSNIASFVRGDADDANIRISNGEIVWDAVSGAKVYQLQLNGIKVNCNTATDYELGTNFNSGYYDISIKIIVNDNTGTSNININTLFSSEIEAYKLAQPSILGIYDGEITLSTVEYKFVGDPIAGVVRDYTFEYGLNTETLSIESSSVGSVSVIKYSDMVNQSASIRYMCCGDDYNLNSDWSNTLVNTYGTQLATPTNVHMTNGVLSWDEIPQATLYVLYGVYQNEDGLDAYEIFVLPENYMENPFRDTLLGSGSIDIGVFAIGDSVYTNSRMSALYTVTYLPVPQNVTVKNGLLSWSGGYSINGYRLTITEVTSDLLVNGTTQIVNTNYYNMSTYLPENYKVSIVSLGNGAEVVNSLVSDLFYYFKLTRPEAGANSAYLDGGYLSWSASKEFLGEKEMTDLDGQSPFTGVEVSFVATDGSYSATLTVTSNIEITEYEYYFNLILESYFENVPAKIYDIIIRNIGNTIIEDENGFVSSNQSNQFRATKLECPQNIVIEDGYLKWTNNENNNGYRLYLMSESDTQVIEIPKKYTTSECVYNLNNVAVGDYSILLYTVGNNKYLSSSSSIELVFTKLTAPDVDGSPFMVQDGIMIWNDINGADSYTLHIASVVSNEQSINIELTGIVGEMGNANVEYELPQNIPAGEYNIRLKSVGNGSRYLDSEYTAIKVVVKNSQVDELGNSVGKLVWKDMCYGDTTNPIQAYEISLYNAQNSLNYSVIAYVDNIDNNSKNAEIIDGYCYFELPSSIPSNSYIIKVKALGNDSIYLNGSYSDEITAYRLNTITNVYISNGIVVWTYTGEGQTGFYLVIDNETREGGDNLIKVQQSEFPDDVDSGEHSIGVKVIGNTVADNDYTTSRYLTSSVVGIDGTVEKLETVENFNIQEGILTWDRVEGASTYEIEFTYNQTMKTIRTNELDVDLGKYVFEPIGCSDGNPIYPNTTYTSISIRAIGSSMFINSKYVDITAENLNVESTNVYKLPIPTSVESYIDINSNKLMKWGAVTYVFDETTYIVNKYRLKLYNTDTGYTDYVDLRLNTENMEFFYFMNGEGVSINLEELAQGSVFVCNLSVLLESITSTQGNYNIYVQAVPSSRQIGLTDNYWFDSLSSDFSNPVAVSIPQAPTNLIFDTTLRAFTWDALVVSEGIDVKYDLLIYRISGGVGEFFTAEVTQPIYYPTSLGQYKVIVRAKVSGSLASAYIGVGGESPYYMVQGSSEIFTDFEDIGTYSISGLYNFATAIHDLFAGGDGSQINPYIISTPEQFYNINYYYIAGFYFIQNNNIDFSTYSGSTIINVGSMTKPFAGVYNGNNYTVSNIKYNYSSSYIGLFVYINEAYIKNVIIVNTALTIGIRGDLSVGLLVGKAQNSTIENCKTSGSIVISYRDSSSATYRIGGILGMGVGDSMYIFNCLNMATIGAPLTGSNTVSTAGGIVGKLSNNDNSNNIGLYKCGNLGAISGTLVGGLVGECTAPIRNCFNTGNITSFYASVLDSIAGGIVGLHSYIMNLDISNTYNTGNVSTTCALAKVCYAGGAVGKGNSNLRNFYNAGNVTAFKVGVSYIDDYVGWIVGNAVSSEYEFTYQKAYTVITIGKDVGLGSFVGSSANSYTTIAALSQNLTTLLGTAFYYDSVNNLIRLVIESELGL